MSQLELILWATRHGYEPFRADNREALVKVLQGYKVRKLRLTKKRSDGAWQRLVISEVACRMEMRGEIGADWFRLRSGYLKNLSLTNDDKLSGLTRSGC